MTQDQLKSQVAKMITQAMAENKLTKKQIQLLEHELYIQLGIPVVEPTGKRGRPKGTKNGTSTKVKDKWAHLPVANAKRNKHKYNPTTNILMSRPRPVLR